MDEKTEVDHPVANREDDELYVLGIDDTKEAVVDVASLTY